jgi:hypothetical protein
MMILAGEPSPLQAVGLGVAWVAWFGTLAIWPRQFLKLSRRWGRWNLEGGGPWAGWPPERAAKPWEPADRVVTVYRWVGAVATIAGLWMIAAAIARF